MIKMRYNFQFRAFAILLLLIIMVSCSGNRQKSLFVVQTTDLHGTILPYDFIEKGELNASLAHSATYLKNIRNSGKSVILLDNGDNLQGQPSLYYYNFIDTVSQHISSEAMNYIGFDAGTVGNHDIEAGHSVYDRLVKEYKFPLLAANAVDINTGKPYFKPYTIIVRDGIKVAVLGLVTPAIPNWLPPELYEGIRFDDMVHTAEVWMPEILKEKPDLVIGLFHDGWDKDDYQKVSKPLISENGSAAVAYNIPGFDIIFTGHDHKVENEKFVNIAGDTILILNGGSYSRNLAVAEITLNDRKRNTRSSVKGRIIDVRDFSPDREFTEKFENQNNTILNYVDKVIGNSTAAMSSRDSYFGSSAFVDLVHLIQLEITGADISFAAPLSFDMEIRKGPVTVGDMFKLYKYENLLYSITMTGAEIDSYLEYSYANWFNTMKGPGDMLLKLRTGTDGEPTLTNGKAWLKNLPYNFDSASGIEYTVDVREPEGERITISGFSDGRPFIKDKEYKVALNSYRGNGGGGILTEGAGITNDEVWSRLISSTERDLRYYIMNYIEEKKTISPQPFNNWKVIPEEWVKKAAGKEYTLLFGTQSN